jgi:hypothetical protein
MSTEEERENLFGPSPQPMAAIRPTVRMAQRLHQLETGAS